MTPSVSPTSPTAGATGTYLDTIVADVRARLERAAAGADADAAGTAEHPDDGVAARSPRKRRSLIDAVAASRAEGALAVIAECKRRSPSRGALAAADLDPAAVAEHYERGGASGMSVLTEPDHFGGSLGDLRVARAVARRMPVLCKDFVVSPVQLPRIAAAGADAVLLIAALHDVRALQTLTDAAHELGLEVLLEVHDAQELERALTTNAVLIGINNRNLSTFEVDLAVTEQLAPRVPDERLVVSESGIMSPVDARRVQAAGAHAVLVGEHLMRAPDPADAIGELRRPEPAPAPAPGRSGSAGAAHDG